MELLLLEHPSCVKVNSTPLRVDAVGSGKEWNIDLSTFKLWNYNELTKERIAEGFYGVVSKVTHPRCKEIMVLKELKKTPHNEANNRRMFEDEIRLISKLHHPNLLEFRGIAIHNGNVCLLSEYIDGGSLEQNLMDKSECLSSWETCLEIGLDTARGMTYLHSCGIIHRDLASRNILLKRRPVGVQAIVADLGLCCTLPEIIVDPASDKCFALGMVGSPFHMAPEVMNAKPYNQKADVFSFGIILCEMMSGCPGGDPDDVPRTNDFGLAVEEFSHRVLHCPVELLNVCVQCCQLDPQKRPAFVDLVKSLDIILDIWHELEEKRVQAASPGVGRDCLIEEWTTCCCDNASFDESTASAVDLGIKESRDRFGMPYRTGSRRLLRQLVGRCKNCGGRLLPVPDSPSNVSRATTNNDTAVASGFASKNSSAKLNGCDTDLQLFTPSSLLKRDTDEMSERTSNLAQNTPGKLPRFFQYIIKTRRSKYRVKSPRRRGPSSSASSSAGLEQSKSDLPINSNGSSDVVLRRHVNRALSEPPDVDLQRLTMDRRRYSMPLRSTTEKSPENDVTQRKTSDNSPVRRANERKQRSHSFFNILTKMRSNKSKKDGC